MCASGIPYSYVQLCVTVCFEIPPILQDPHEQITKAKLVRAIRIMRTLRLFRGPEENW